MKGDYTKIPIDYDPHLVMMQGVAYHGDTPFKCPVISHIEGNLYQGGCMDLLILPDNIVHLVSLYPWERYTIKHEMLSELYVKAYDDDISNVEKKLQPILEWMHQCVLSGPTLVHCQAGLNRSGLLTALYLIRYQHYTPDEAIKKLRSTRSPAVLCNQSFEQYVRSV